MISFCKPYKDCKPSDMSQGYWSGHQANDFASKYGTFLVAPFDCKITVVRTIQNQNQQEEYLAGGCGVRMESIEDPTLSVVYWHCLEVFPVEVGDIVKQGQPVAQMGNTGFVMSGGQIVSVEQREQENVNSAPNNLPWSGVHTHITAGHNDNSIDFHTMIDWSIPVKYDLLTTIKVVLQNISNILLNK